jgi:hypothetical protein
MFLSNGVTFNEYIDGKVVFGAYTDAGRVALERARTIYTETCVDYIYPDVHNGDYFLNGDVVMQANGNGTIISTIMYEMDNVGIVPFPQGPNATPGVYYSYYEQIPYTTSIPVNTVDTGAVAKILDAMFEPFDGLETKDDIVEYMSEQVFFDHRDTWLVVNAVANTEYGFFWEGGRSGIETCLSGSTSVTSNLESYEDIYDELVEDYLISHYEGRVAVYGE